MTGFLTKLLGDPVAVGTQIEADPVLSHTGETIDPKKAFADGLVLVYFYPKADTPGCTKQACNLRDDFARLQDAGIRVFGVSTDSVASQAAFREKYDLPFTLLADEDKILTKAFGVPVRMGMFASRQTFLLKDGKVVWRDTSASPASQAQDALAAARDLEDKSETS